jgi:2-dehydro-3-deoxygalactonokinase
VIAIDWGTSSFRAYRLNAAGAVLDKRSAALGILHVEGGRFAQALESQVQDWIEAGEQPIVMCGMIGSRQGWVEAPYVPCPAGVDGIANGMRGVEWLGRRGFIAPGLSSRDGEGVPDVMRGEETQILGVLDSLPASGAWICLPGTHSKWVEVKDRRILRFTTHMTGEVFAVLREHSILGRMMSGAATDLDWFDAGAQRAQQPGGLLHHLFGVRARGLFGELPDGAAASYLSGILVGHELAGVRSGDGPVYLLGSSELAGLYQRALRQVGRACIALDPDAVVVGLFLLANRLAGK